MVKNDNGSHRGRCNSDDALEAFKGASQWGHGGGIFGMAATTSATETEGGGVYQPPPPLGVTSKLRGHKDGQQGRGGGVFDYNCTYTYLRLLVTSMKFNHSWLVYESIYDREICRLGQGTTPYYFMGKGFHLNIS